MYNGHELIVSEDKLDEILNKQSVTYNFNLVDEYNNLAEGDKEALKHLVRAAYALDPIYLKQDNKHNVEMKNALEKAAKEGNTHAQKALILFNIFKGIEGDNGIDKEPVRLFSDLKLATGKNLYPEGMTSKELIDYISGHLDQAQEILCNHTIIQRQNDELVAVPYAVAFREEYLKAADELDLAANSTTHREFSEYLKLQAKALRTGEVEDQAQADKIWANLKDCPIEFTIGLESYDDTLTGALAEDSSFMHLMKENNIQVQPKDFVGGRVGIVDIKASKDLAEYKTYLKDLGQLMPLKDQYKQSIELGNAGEDTKQTLADVDLVYLSGDYAACRPGITLAQNLPNDDKLSVQRNYGRRNVFHKQIRRTFDPEKRQKMLNALVDPSQHKWYEREADHLFTIGHELTHSLGPIETVHHTDKKTSLGDGYGDILEEAKADLGSLVATPYFVKIGKYSVEDENKIYLTWAVDQLPLSEPDKKQAHRVREVMQLNYFMNEGAIKFKKGGKLSIEKEKMVPTAYKMLEDVIKIQLSGNAQEAKEFVDKYRKWNEDLQYASDILKSLTPKPYKILNMSLAEQFLSDK